MNPEQSSAPGCLSNTLQNTQIRLSERKQSPGAALPSLLPPEQQTGLKTNRQKPEQMVPRLFGRQELAAAHSAFRGGGKRISRGWWRPCHRLESPCPFPTPLVGRGIKALISLQWPNTVETALLSLSWAAAKSRSFWSLFHPSPATAPSDAAPQDPRLWVFVQVPRSPFPEDWGGDAFCSSVAGGCTCPALFQLVEKAVKALLCPDDAKYTWLDGFLQFIVGSRKSKWAQ